MRPRGRAIIIFFVFLFIFNICQPVVAAFASFHDVPQDYWADPYIRKLKQLGYAQGEADGSYAPESHITNAEFIAFVCRMTGMDDTRLDRGAHWAEPSVEYARFMAGSPLQKYRCKYDEPISREIAAKILMLGLFKDEALRLLPGNPI